MAIDCFRVMSREDAVIYLFIVLSLLRFFLGSRCHFFLFRSRNHLFIPFYVKILANCISLRQHDCYSQYPGFLGTVCIETTYIFLPLQLPNTMYLMVIISSLMKWPLLLCLYVYWLPLTLSKLLLCFVDDDHNPRSYLEHAEKCEREIIFWSWNV